MIHWNQDIETLFVGLDSGKVYIYNVPKEYNYMRYSEDEPMDTHKKRVMGLHYDKEYNLLYSVSEDGHFKVTNCKTRTVSFDLVPSKAGLKYMLQDSKRAVFILGDGDGFIFVYSQLSVYISLEFILS